MAFTKKQKGTRALNLNQKKEEYNEILPSS